MTKPMCKKTMGVIIIGVVAAVGLAFQMLIPPSPRIVWNASASIPTGFYFVEKRQPVLGEIAVIRAAEWVQLYASSRGYLPRNAWLLKPIAAVHGSIVCRVGKSVFIDGKRVAKAKTFDKNVRILPTWKGCRLLKPDEVFVLARPRDSFDSRYFSVVKIQQIVGTAIPLSATSK